MDEIVRKHVYVKMVLDVIKSPVVVRVQLDILVRLVNLVRMKLFVEKSIKYFHKNVDHLHMDFIVLKHVIVQQKHQMVVMQKQVNVDVNLVIMVIDVKQVRNHCLVDHEYCIFFVLKGCPQGQWGEECLNKCDCNENTCHSETGLCDCPAGRTGIRCEQGINAKKKNSEI